MDEILEFTKGKVGIDIINSARSDVERVSKEIENVLGLLERDDHRTVIEYYDFLKGLKEKDWEILLYEPDLGDFNGYRGYSAYVFRNDNKVMLASEMLIIEFEEIEENKLDKLFE